MWCYFFKFLGRKHWIVWWWSQYSMCKYSSCVSHLSPLSLCVSLFPSNRSGSTSPQNHSVVIKHTPPSSIYTLPLSLSLSIPLLVSVFPTSICSAFPGSQWNERRACTLTGWNWTGLGACSLSLSHTHRRSLTHSRSRKQTDSVSPTAPCQAGTRTCMRCRAHTHRRTNTLSVIVNPVASTLGWGDVLG